MTQGYPEDLAETERWERSKQEYKDRLTAHARGTVTRPAPTVDQHDSREIDGG